jgi:hypothetical protein
MDDHHFGYITKLTPKKKKFDYHNTQTYLTLKNYLPQISNFQKLQVSIDETFKNINLMVGLPPCFFDA